MLKKTLWTLLIIFSQTLQTELFAANTITLDNSTTTNPSGTYTTSIQLLDGFTQMRGIVVTNGQDAPVAYINQAVDAASALAGTWHGTDTVTFVQSGSIWRGEIKADIFGKYGRLSVGGFGTSSFSKINWYSSFETTVSTTINLTTTTVGSGTVSTIGTTNTTLLSTNASRKYLLITNTGNQDLYVDPLSPVATATAKIWIAANGGSWEKESISAIYTGTLYCITGTATTEVRVFEHN